ncbi:MAG: hypothetical protein HQ564_09045 [Candidatus Saganbacteria bacterium]|nr:hypothetical protein [Candidatus Saganbacteria bacterium]
MIIRANKALRSYDLKFTRTSNGGDVKITNLRLQSVLPEKNNLSALLGLWNNAWRIGIDYGSPCAITQEETLLVSLDQIRQMHHNPSYIKVVLDEDENIVGAIWSTRKESVGDFLPSNLRDYWKTTDLLTLNGLDPTGNTCICFSVGTDHSVRGLKNNDLSVGQHLARSRVIDSIVDPFFTRTIAYSRPLSLSQFILLLNALKKERGYLINYEDVESRGIRIDGELITPRDVELGKIDVLPDGYYLDGEKLYTDKKGVYAIRAGRKDYLVDIWAYHETPFDLMKKIHGIGLGGKIHAIIPHSRVHPKNEEISDLVALGYNTIYKFPIWDIARDNLAEVVDRFSQDQLQVLQDILRGDLIHLNHTKDMYKNAFSLEKIWILETMFVNPNREQLEVLID